MTGVKKVSRGRRAPSFPLFEVAHQQCALVAGSSGSRRSSRGPRRGPRTRRRVNGQEITRRPALRPPAPRRRLPARLAARRALPPRTRTRRTGRRTTTSAGRPSQTGVPTCRPAPPSTKGSTMLAPTQPHRRYQHVRPARAGLAVERFSRRRVSISASNSSCVRNGSDPTTPSSSQPARRDHARQRNVHGANAPVPSHSPRRGGRGRFCRLMRNARSRTGIVWLVRPLISSLRGGVGVPRG